MRSTRIFCLCLFILVASAPSFAAGKPPRFKIKSVVIAGNHAYTDTRLQRVMISRPSVLFNPVYYYAQILKDDITNLELFYHNNGYLEAKVEDFSVVLDSVKHRADIHIRVDEGKLTRVDGITIFDNTVFSDSVLMRLIPFKSGDPLLQGPIDDGTLAILTLYAEHGYLDATAIPEVRLDSLQHLAQIDYFVKENTQYSIDTTIFKGLNKTKSKVVLRELEFKNGQIVNYTQLIKSQRNLYLTGLFQSAFVRPVTSLSGNLAKKDVLVEVKENKSLEYSFSIGYGTVEGGRIGVGLYNKNWRGSAQKLGLAAKLSFIEAGIVASFSEPWTFNTRWRTDVVLATDYLINPAYDQSMVGGSITIGRVLLHKWSTNLTYRHENVDLSKVKVFPIPNDTSAHIRSLKLTFSRDTRDNLFNPTNGSYFEESIETAGLFLGATISFTRAICIAKFFRTVSPGTVLGTGLDLAWMESPRGFNSIALSERLYAGGPSSLRAFKYQRAGPLDINGYPLGGGFMMVWNAVEVRQALYKIIGGVVFLDLGNVWNSIHDASIRGIRASPGVGLRLDTPLGLFRTDYGFNIDSHGSESSGVIYFSVGQAF